MQISYLNIDNNKYAIKDAEAREYITDINTTISSIQTSIGDTSLLPAPADSITKNIKSLNDNKANTSHSHNNYASTISTTGSGNAITAISQSGNTITATKGTTFSTSGHTHDDRYYTESEINSKLSGYCKNGNSSCTITFQSYDGNNFAFAVRSNSIMVYNSSGYCGTINFS